MPDEAEVHGLHALLLFQDARREARVSPEGALVLLDDQDRSLWDEAELEQGRAALERALALRIPGPYQVQAAIASLHAEAATDWGEIALLYSRLLDFTPSPVVELNRAVAVALAHGAEQGLVLADAIEGLDEYYLLHSTRADLLRRLGRRSEAVQAYERALALAPTEVERAFLRGRMVEGERGRT
jgi:RNA polymerase sigma-70 factor (ECF subfamily)